ncbi:MAG: ABC transporter ATP-binding protein [Clostridiaceae bacterium]|uniref:ABC transporter ATP-binding protein n=1 Tax=Clostridium porci TaxID=2605778 RepID=A0A7X2NKF7_9CLOT|nr:MULTISPECIES: ABC transporter ATP-binding protein [Clostridium]MCI6140721.1 ABC transporter ATP-binding protein [Clostridium sp.]MDY3231804.1 ABC transporter ATP-binding protein [Clostridiaceae bacterium]MSS36335.1 ABC transporter ATP-binding protein [Clostridium porci]
MEKKKDKIVLKARDILKVYPNGVVANKNVNLEIYEGEIHALIGENGAGKSTLMKILFGMETPEGGHIFLNGEEVKIDSPKKAISLGIGMVHQHFMLVDSLTIAENIVLGSEPSKYGMLMDTKEMIRISKACADKYNFKINVNEKVENASVGIKQETEILKALVRGAKILILDEPTAVLTPQETKLLFEELNSLKKQGHTIIFISHKLNEIMEICDRVTIMRHGTTIETTYVKDTSPQDISNKMVGREIVLHIDKKPAEVGAVCLEAENLTYVNSIGKKMLDNVSLKLRAGEILSVAGVEGNGQSELAEVLTGMKKPMLGQVKISGMEVLDYSPAEFRRKQVVYIPEDRMAVGCAADMTISENMFADKIQRYLIRNIFLDRKRMDAKAKEWVKDFNVLCTSAEQDVNMLSGGNIQKVVAARELTENVGIVVAEQPTRGIDAGASELIRTKLVELRDRGVAVLLISADLNEILELSDSCIVMYNGKINAYFKDTTNLTEEELGYYMLGVKKQSEEEVRALL